MADGSCHRKQLILPDEAELCFVLIGVADGQLRGLQRVAETGRLDPKMDDLPVGQDENFLPGAGDALHIYHKNAVGGKNSLVTHGLVGPHDLLPVQQHGLHTLADVFLFDADKVLHRLFPEFHLRLPFPAALRQRLFWAQYSISPRRMQAILAFWGGMCYTCR